MSLPSVDAKPDVSSPPANRITTLLFDLDGTLYPIDNGYEDLVRKNLFNFMHAKLGVPREQAPEVWAPLFRQHNQSLKGLRAGGFEFDTEEYWDWIRAGADQFLKPDPKVRALLESLPHEKWVLTNCNEKHAHAALQLLNLQDCFKGVLGADFMGAAAKPDPEVFQAVLKRTGALASRTAMFEDSFRNLRQAKALGMTTILVGGRTASEEQVQKTEMSAVLDAVIDVPHESAVREAVPHLWA